MKYFICYLALVCLLSCKQNDNKTLPILPSTMAQAQPPMQTHKEDSILIRLGGDSCAYVSFDLERDSNYNKLLRAYLCHNKFGNDSIFSPSQFADLVKRPSFCKMILLFYDGDKYGRVYTDIEAYRLPDLRSGFLLGIAGSDLDQEHLIADSLLKRDYDDGLDLLWGIADMKKLPSLKEYLRRVDTDNFYKDADLVAFFHNIGNDSLRDMYLAKAGKIIDFREKFRALKSLIIKNKSFDKGTYNELIYGTPY